MTEDGRRRMESRGHETMDDGKLSRDRKGAVKRWTNGHKGAKANRHKELNPEHQRMKDDIRRMTDEGRRRTDDRGRMTEDDC